MILVPLYLCIKDYTQLFTSNTHVIVHTLTSRYNHYNGTIINCLNKILLQYIYNTFTIRFNRPTLMPVPTPAPAAMSVPSQLEPKRKRHDLDLEDNNNIIKGLFLIYHN